jgi:hypothetical protein
LHGPAARPAIRVRCACELGAWIVAGLFAALGVASAYGTVIALRSRTAPRVKAVKLAFPLQPGVSGTSVAAGDWVGSVGNSGNTGEPHLHVHAQSPGPAGAPLGGDPLPILFQGRFPVRGDRIASP